MSDTLPERPIFTSGQYIGAADLNAAVDYARDETRRLALSARTWGIATGLGLVEVPTTGGGVQMFIEPGIAWDGYGRPVVVLAPAPVTPDLFASLATGNQIVWLRYSAAGTQAIAPGFQTCGAGDPSTRIAESYAIEAGNETVGRHTDGLVIAGATVADPRDMLIAVDTNAAVVLDGSAAHQSFPDDTGRWLIPVGIAAYTAGTPGCFSARSAAQLALSRTTRRIMGAVAESLLAADGVLRLRERLTDQRSGVTDDQLDAAAGIQPSDLSADPNNAGRLIGNELVWVEGNLRVTGNARMYGTQLELRDLSGAEDNAPEFLRRGVSANNTMGGQDLQICIGSTVTGTAGADRLAIGVLTSAVNPIASTTADGALSELMVVRTDARVAIGTNAIDSYSSLANQLVVATTADTGITVVSGVTSTGNLFFADGTNKTGQKDGFVAYDHGKQQLALGANATTMLVATPGDVVIGPADPAIFSNDTDQLVVASSDDGAGITIAGKQNTLDAISFADCTSAMAAGYIRYFLKSNEMEFGTKSATRFSIDGGGRVGIGTTSPSSFDGDANQLVVTSTGGEAGITINAGSAGRLDFADGSGTPHAGFIRYDQQNSRMELGTGSSARVYIDQKGQVGIGTDAPDAALEIKQGNASLSLSVNWVQASDSGNSAALELQPNGGAVGIGLGTSGSPAATLHVRTNGSFGGFVVEAVNPAATAISTDGGRVSMGHSAKPRTTLDVQGSLKGQSIPPPPEQHLVIVENTSTGAANVLALKVGASEAADTDCSFITFFDGNGDDLGAVVGLGTPNLAQPYTISYQSAGADYAEAVRRAPDVAAIGPGKIVGVRAGLVSLVTDGADAVFVTSESPAMLARMPHRSQRDAHEMLAFVGQVPVMVAGPVRSGDLIVASGQADGMGRAVPLGSVQPDDLPLIVGRAWESPDGVEPRRVNVHVGPGVATAAAGSVLITRQAREIERLAALLERREPPGTA